VAQYATAAADGERLRLLDDAAAEQVDGGVSCDHLQLLPFTAGYSRL
jgi:hypothetical protein